MRLESLQIVSYRNLRNISFSISNETNIVCLIGANASGKSNVLELVAAVASVFGIAQGADFMRGSPLSEQHELTAVLAVDDDVVAKMPPPLVTDQLFSYWNRRLRLRSKFGTPQELQALGSFPVLGNAVNYAQHVVRWLSQTETTYLFSMDSDRAYPRLALNQNELAQVMANPTESDRQRKMSAAQRASTKFETWIRYLLKQSVTASLEHAKRERQAKRKGTERPAFQDELESYRSALRLLLPHLDPIGMNTERKQLDFEVENETIPFEQLSSGEKELAFMVGQFDRYKLERGLLLIDEPELHLNPAILRRWIGFLKSASTRGQVWIATHSLEVVEAAGFDNTFLLNKEADSSIVGSATRLEVGSAQRALVGVLGLPAFSLAQQTLVLVEGERSGTERARFEAIVQDPVFRFTQVGGADEVARLSANLRDLFDEMRQPLSVCGVIDTDEKTADSIAEITLGGLVFALPCHEVENVFLEPGYIEQLAKAHGKANLDGTDLVRELSDLSAGRWILQYAMIRVKKRPPEVMTELRRLWMPLAWTNVDAAKSRAESIIPSLASADVAEAMITELSEAIEAYRTARTMPNLWQRCNGKEVLKLAAGRLGFTNSLPMEVRLTGLWSQVGPPKPVADLRDFLARHRPPSET